MKKITMKVNAKSEGMTVRASTKKHEIVIDEGKQMGGQDLGMNPLQAVLSSLAACENVTARVTAKEMDFDLQDFSVEVQGTFDPRGFMGVPDVCPYFESVTVEVTVTTNESEDRLQELKENVESRCPVYTMMKAAGVQMNDTWKKAD
ncbi:putative OsmC-like protein [Bacillus ectoiniformans]|uniref:OsmC family protein n=1 Tax=Bacillus ectoiniformans TaxID=1494429 RepID=UPI00195B4C10|nr:OsmC family protein [Bacillus ectoiniformans]MBM7650241.1 putative OsmC-like protein [Bacillus ectoiniformans]